MAVAAVAEAPRSARTRMRLEVVTPEIAVQWLEKNTANRNVIQASVDEFSRDMSAGNWRVTGDPIRFDVNGDLVDGQHRLWACVLAGVPFETYVVRGLEEDVRLVIDTGRRRSLAHAMQIQGEGNATVLAGVVNTVWKYDRDRWSSNQPPTHAEGLSFLADNPLARDAAAMGVHVRHHMRLAPTPIASAFLINARVDAEAAESFWASAASGAELRKGDPILAFRRWAMVMLSARDKPSSKIQLAYALKAMTAWYEGRAMRLLSWKSFESMPEPWQPSRRKAPVGS